MMKLINGHTRAKGFTLVEMLIVVIIIGILSGMMIISTGSASDKAEATRIVSDMRNIKTACLMYYADYNKWPSKIDVSVDQYLDVPVSSATTFSLTSADACIWLKYEGGKLVPNGGIAEKLAAMAVQAGLYSAASGESQRPDYNGGGSVYMLVKK